MRPAIAARPGHHAGRGPRPSLLGTAGCARCPTCRAATYAAAPTSEAPVETPWLHRVAEPVVDTAAVGQGRGREASSGGSRWEAAYAETVAFASDDHLRRDRCSCRARTAGTQQRPHRRVSRMTADDGPRLQRARRRGPGTASRTPSRPCSPHRFFSDDDPRLPRSRPDGRRSSLNHVRSRIRASVSWTEARAARRSRRSAFVERGDVRMRGRRRGTCWSAFTKTATYCAWPRRRPATRSDGASTTAPSSGLSADPVPDTGTY